MAIDEIRMHLKTLRMAENIIDGIDPMEIRTIGTGNGKKKIQGHFFNKIEEAAQFCESMNGKADVYVTLNPIGRDAVMNNLTCDQHIVGRSWLIADFDVKKPKDTQSTPEQKAAALAMARRYIEAVKQSTKPFEGRCSGFRDPLVTDSGNGIKVCFFCDISTREEYEAIVDEFYDICKEMFSDDVVEFDTSVKNPARIERVCGCINLKGKGTPGYEERIPHIIERPEKLEHGMITTIDDVRNFNRIHRVEMEESDEISEIKQQEIIKKVLDKAGIKIANTKKCATGPYEYILTLDHCINEKEHTTTSPGSTAVFIGRDGKIGYKCQHNHCTHITWKVFRKMVDPTYQERKLAVPNSLVLFCEQYSEANYLKVIYCPELGQWYTNDDQEAYWTKASEDAIREHVKDWAKWKYDAEMEKINKTLDLNPIQKPNGKIETDEERDKRVAAAYAPINYIKKLMDTEFAKAMTMIRSDKNIRVSLERMDNYKDRIVILDGKALERKTGEIHDDRIENLKLYQTNHLNSHYNPEAKCPKLMNVLMRVFQGRQFTRDVLDKDGKPVLNEDGTHKTAYLDPERKEDTTMVESWPEILSWMTVIGYTIDGTNLQRYVLMLGQSGTGKGTLSDIFTQWIGDLAGTAADGLFLLNGGGSDAQFGMADVINKLWVNISEIPASQTWNWSKFKRFTARDPMSVNRKGLPITTERPRGVCIIQSNHEISPDAEEAESVERRQFIVPFMYKQKQDSVEIVNEIINEESDGMLNFVIACLKKFHEYGLVESDAALRLEREWSIAHRNVREIMKIMTDPDDKGGELELKDIYDTYDDLMSRIGDEENMLTKKRFAKTLRTEGFTIRTDNQSGRRFVQNVRWKEQWLASVNTKPAEPIGVSKPPRIQATSKPLDPTATPKP